jgi:hypothetical protein
LAKNEPHNHRKSVVLAFLLGVVFLGCFYVDRRGTGFLILFLLVVGGVTAPIGFGIFIVAVTWFSSIAISVSAAKKHNKFHGG